MPRVKPEQRIRAKRPKTRTGCRTCKTRRVKCDEARCTSSGRTCDGYDDLFVDALALSFSCPHPTLSTPGSRDELRAVAFFRDRTAPQLAGFYSCEFWDKVILQAAQTDIGLRHALVALAAVHEDYEQGRVDDGDNARFALSQYNLAIEKHIKTVVSHNGATLDNYLAPCLVFICIEMLQRRFGSALSLVKRAVRMFYDASFEEQQASAWPVEIFESILARLQTQALGLVGSPAVGATNPPRVTPTVLRGIPDTFTSVAEAKQLFDFYTNTYILSVSHKLGYDTSDLAARSPLENSNMEIFTRWSAAFDALLASSYDKMTQRDQNAARVLQMRRLLLSTSLDIAARNPSAIDRQMLWDEYDSIYNQIITLAEETVQTMQPSGPGKVPRRQFTLDWGIVGPVYDTVLRCRDPTIRRKAIRLLYQNPCQEGMWDSTLAARVAERVVQLEEENCPGSLLAAEVADEYRISSVVPSFDLGSRTARISYSRHGDSSPLVTTMRLEESIHW